MMDRFIPTLCSIALPAPSFARRRMTWLTQKTTD
ncbi:hypothetical protein SAMN05216227_101515 [Pseudorhodobacter antarcticus]|uniref:Uncharacterized protein n=1 Tax=Pseudorhodobacter antarcticus TaxID=1077947 RepID=A0A1H8GV92_9RHOB|nr:hypothetical protein SAMN05216227_101515 [Pseudorhodobacter antarcticus]